MATVTKKFIKSDPAQIGGVPYGNKTVLPYTFETNASGVYVNSNQTTAVLIADVVRIGILPAGAKLLNSLAIVSNAFTALSTAKVGFAYVDGVDSTAVPQDDDYFNAALALNAQGRTAANNLAVAPVTLPKDAYLILTIAGANLAEVGVLDLLIDAILTGAP